MLASGSKELFLEGEKLPPSAVSNSEPTKTSPGANWPLVRPGIILAVIALVANLGVAIAIETGDLFVNFYPELLTVPVFIYWLYVLFKLHAVLKKVSNGTYPIGPIQASVSAFFAGSLAFYLAGLVLAPIAHLLFLLSESGPENYQIFMKSGGLMLIAGVVIGSFCAAGLYTTVVVFRIFGTLSKFGVQNGLDKSVLSRYIVASALIAPAMLQSVNSWGSYTNFLLFSAGHALAYLVCFVCVWNICKRFKTVDWSAKYTSPQAVPGIVQSEPEQKAITAETEGEKLKLEPQPEAIPAESDFRS